MQNKSSILRCADRSTVQNGIWYTNVQYVYCITYCTILYFLPYTISLQTPL